MVEEADINNHPQTIAVKKVIDATLSREDRGRVKVDGPFRRQKQAVISLENFDVISVTELQLRLPSGCKVFARAVSNRDDENVVLSCLVIYYPLHNFIWRIRHFLFIFIWFVAPLCVALTIAVL